MKAKTVTSERLMDSLCDGKVQLLNDSSEKFISNEAGTLIFHGSSISTFGTLLWPSLSMTQTQRGLY